MLDINCSVFILVKPVGGSRMSWSMVKRRDWGCVSLECHWHAQRRPLFAFDHDNDNYQHGDIAPLGLSFKYPFLFFLLH